MDASDGWLKLEALDVTVDGPVRIVTMNRPESLNAADAVMHRELAEVWSLLAADPRCRAVVLTGAGRAFSAGGDLPRMVATQQDQAIQDEVFDEARRTVLGMLDLPQPLIAAVNGPAVGLGASLVSLCDLAIASETAFLADPHLGVGLVPADGAALLWPMMMGLMRAKEYVFTGERIPAATAQELGLVNKVVPAGEVLRLRAGARAQARRAPCAGAARHQAGDEPACHPGARRDARPGPGLRAGERELPRARRADETADRGERGARQKPRFRPTRSSMISLVPP